MLGEILHVSHAGLFAGAQHEVEVVIELRSCIPESFHYVEPADGCGFVVSDASSEQISVLEKRSIRLGNGPVASGGNDVQVGEHADGIFLAKVILDRSHIVFVVVSLEAFRFAFGEHMIQDLPASGTEGLDVAVIQRDALDAGDRCEIPYDVILVGIDVAVDFFD